MLNTSSNFPWPPLYSLKKHKRAKHVKLRVSEKGLVITIPYRFSKKEIPYVLEVHKEWIIKQFSKLPVKADILPENITLYGQAEIWPISYVNSHLKWEIIEKPQQQLMIIGDVRDKEACKKHLLKWIKQRAKIVLLERLEQISQAINLTYRSAGIRDQKTIWGSCTAGKHISLSYKLIFLPSHLMDYVIIHELCHTKHLNHSLSFWRLVASYDQNCQQHRQELRRVKEFIPDWI